MRSGGTENKRMKNKSQSREARPSGSSSSTPGPGGSTVSVVIDAGTTAYLRTPLNHLLVPSNATLEDILDRGGNSNTIPSATALNTMLQNVKTRVFNPTRMRGEVCDRGMRELARRRKERIEQELEKERERTEQEASRKVKTKRSQSRKDKDADRPLAVGAHGVARQDGGAGGAGTRTGITYLGIFWSYADSCQSFLLHYLHLRPTNLPPLQALGRP